MRSTRLLILFLTFLLATSLPAAPGAVAQAVPDAGTAQLPAGGAEAEGAPADLDALGNDLFAQSGSTGMVLVVVKDNKVSFRGYGETAPGSHQTPDEHSVVRLCSLTKIFTTDLLTKLVADKTVRLDDPLQRYAPTGIKVPERQKPVTLEELATHTSGLPRELGYGPPMTPHFTYPDYATRWRWVSGQRLRFVPGTSALYSNVAYDFLGDALSTAAHKQYAALLAARTLTPLHMWNTTYFPTPAQCARLLGTAHDEGPCTITEETAGSSGLYSTAADMATWLKYLLGTATPAVPAQAEAAQAVYIAPADLVRQRGLDHAGDPTGVGLGWIHILPLDSPSHIVQKTGGGAGFATYIAISHARNTAIFVAATEGRYETHLNLFNAANKLLLAVAGLPPLPPPPPSLKVAAHPRRPRHAHRRRMAAHGRGTR